MGDTLTLSQCTLAGPVYTGMPLKCHWLTQCPLGYHWATQRILAGYTGTPLGKLSWNRPTLECHWRNLVESAPHWMPPEKLSILQPTMEHHWRDCDSPHTPRHIKFSMQSSIHASLKWQDGGTPVSKWTGLCIFSIYLEFTALQWMPVLLLAHTYFNITLCMTLLGAPLSFFVYLGLLVKCNHFSSNNSCHMHTSCIHKGLHAGKWPDLLNSKPDSVSTLGNHWTNHTGRPLEPQVHWDATGTTLADASTQWCPSGDPVLICIIGTH